MKNYYLKNECYYIFCFLTLLFSSTIHSQTNLVVDPSFEDGASAWVISSGAIRSASVAKSGSYSVIASDYSGASQTISGLTPFTTYELSCWLKSSSSSSPAQLGVKLYGGNERIVQRVTTVYSQATLKFTTGPASTTAVIYCLNPGGGGNQMAADSFSLIQTTETPYELVWSDEFNGTGRPNAKDWTFEKGFVRGNELQWYQINNATQIDGNLVIEARKEDPQDTRLNPNYTGGNWPNNVYYINYTSSSIKTAQKQSWLYGRFEIRAKVTNLLGTWPAIWTVGESCDWPSGGEIDIMENYTGGILGNFAWGTNNPYSPRWDGVKMPVSEFIRKDPDWVSKFHIWTLDWDENRMSIYVDGDFINDVDLNMTINGAASCPGENPFRKKQSLLLNLAIGGNSGGSIANLKFPTQYLVDYVRVYQLRSTLGFDSANLKDAVKVYPNPVKNVLNIEYPTANPKFKLFDVSGKVLLQGNGSKVDVSKLNSGVYFIQVEDLQSVKIVKE
jgi:beta-glucanase (GH16 family)